MPESLASQHIDENLSEFRKLIEDLGDMLPEIPRPQLLHIIHLTAIATGDLPHHIAAFLYALAIVCPSLHISPES